MRNPANLEREVYLVKLLNKIKTYNCYNIDTVQTTHSICASHDQLIIYYTSFQHLVSIGPVHSLIQSAFIKNSL